MGVRGLKTFMERQGFTKPINVKREVEIWKRSNPNRPAAICVDFMTLVHMINNPAECIVGGCHQQFLSVYEQLFKDIVALGVELVFFSDLNTQPAKLTQWMNRRDDSFEFYKQLYDDIEAGDRIHDIVARRFENNKKDLTSTVYGLTMLAKQYGDFHFSIDHECDLELAQYATEIGAMAIITNDTDFVIFDGKWKLWSANDFDIKKLTTIEYDRNAVLNALALSRQQLYLFATLLGNDFTGEFFDSHLKDFHRNIRSGYERDKFKKVANYVRNMPDIDRAVMDVFRGGKDEAKSQLIRDSIAFYDLNTPKAEPKDPIVEKLLHSNINRAYASRIAPIQGITLCFYDMRGCKNDDGLPNFLTGLLKREMGILRKHEKNDDFTFTLMAKRNLYVRYASTTEKPIYPDFAIPSLQRLLLHDDDDDDDGADECGKEELQNTRWKVFGWILQISDEKIEEIRNLPKDLILIATTLYILVKNSFLDIEASDGILLTEQIVLANFRSGKTIDTAIPSTVITKYVRSAHIYNLVYTWIRTSLELSGLGSSIPTILRFDGALFQTLMNSYAGGKTDKHHLAASIENGRIYA